MAPIVSRSGWNLGFGRRRSVGGGGFSATGGNVSALAPGNGYKYHTFTSPGTFTVNSGSGNIEFLVVGGGGAGGAGTGGGGAGGLAYSSAYPISPGSYSVTIGGGGPAGIPAPSGTNSTFVIGANTITGKGGGGGAVSGGTGGSGGGGAGGGNGGPATQPAEPTFSSLVLHYGNAGGNAPGVNDGAGGGGAGGSGTPGNGGPGGIGRQYPQFTGPLIGVPSLAPLSGYFAGGGGGCFRDGSAGGTGGLGGGANGTTGYPVPGGNATTNSGGGGGGGGTQSGVGNSPGGSGGPGIVIIRYLA